MNNALFHPYRFQIYTCDLGENDGSVQSGKRPVLIIQSNAIHSPTVVVAPITSSIKKPDMVSHIVLSDELELAKDSMVLLEQLRTVNISALECYCGCIRNHQDMKDINDGIKRTLGLWHTPKTKDKVNPKVEKTQILVTQINTCLCHKCVSFYRNSPNYRVKRLTPPQGAKDTCDRCGVNQGFDYLITEMEQIDG